MPDPRLERKDEESVNGAPVQRSYWILSRSTETLDGTPYFTGEADTMILSRDFSEVIPVFSFFEEAELFLWLGGFADDWRVVEVGSRTLIGMLIGPYAGVDEVALDPIPEVQSRSFMGLVTVARERFVASLSGRDTGPPRPVPDAPA